MPLSNPTTEGAGAGGAHAVGVAGAFAATWRRPPARLYRSPGRINLIGEHTDYNDGWVMPAAINLAASVAVAPREDRLVRLASAQFAEAATVNLDDAGGAAPEWARTLAGVARLLDQSAGGRRRGADVLISSDIPVGAGLSSSAAVEVGLGFALASESGLDIERTSLAQLCQRASHEFGGTRCGIMDLYIAAHGRAGQVLELDTRSLAARWWPWPPRLAMVACDTGLHHDNATSDYNQRRAECEAAVDRLRRFLPGLRALRDLTPAQLDEYGPRLDATLQARCRHVVTEDARVAAAAAALTAGDFRRLGELLNASHASLRNDYEVSCPELDLMAEICRRQPGVYGARMMGGGFGGCALAVAEPAAVEALRRRILAEYAPATGLVPAVWACQPADGVARWISDGSTTL
jgi:galactokinase